MSKRVYEFSDELNDDFAATQSIGADRVESDFPYVRGGFGWKLGAFVCYRLIATPVAWLFCKLGFGLRICGRENLKGIRGGFCLYGNHTQHAADAFIPSLISFPRRTYILTGRETVSIPGLRSIVQMMGAMPLPSDAKALPHLQSAIECRLSQEHVVAVYPEAHIWPYYTHIRPFRAGSFVYPVRCGVPAVPYVVTYRRRRLLKNLHPFITVYVGKPIFPDPERPERAERQRLRDEAYAFMSNTAESVDQPEYIRYRRKSTPGNR